MCINHIQHPSPSGAFANAASAIVGHYPWFYTYRVLSKSNVLQKFITSNHLRNASIGFAASVVSDTVANAIRVVKTTKQAIASKHAVGYGEVVAMILAADGWKVRFRVIIFITTTMWEYMRNTFSLTKYSNTLSLLQHTTTQGLFGRGLRTRILGNAVQSVLFTVVWRGLAERKNQRQNNDPSRQRKNTNQDDFDDAALSSGQQGLDDLDAVPMEEERN
jgi:hypothetical protein